MDAISDLKGEAIVGTFYEKELPKKKKSKRVYSWKSNKEKRRETMLNGNATIAILTVGLIKKTL